MEDITTEQEQDASPQPLVYAFTNEQLRYLKTLAEYSESYAWMLHRTAEYYSKISKRLTYSAVICGLVSATMIFGNMFPETINKGVTGSLTMITAILNVTNNHFEYQNKAEKNRDLTKQYRKLFNEIKIILSREDKAKGEDPEMILKTYLKEYTKLEDHSPEIPPWIRDLFDRQHPDISVSTKIGGLGTIRINPIQPISHISGLGLTPRPPYPEGQGPSGRYPEGQGPSGRYTGNRPQQVLTDIIITDDNTTPPSDT